MTTPAAEQREERLVQQMRDYMEAGDENQRSAVSALQGILGPIEAAEVVDRAIREDLEIEITKGPGYDNQSYRLLKR